jgi:broad specificity phosphatase PhoE
VRFVLVVHGEVEPGADDAPLSDIGRLRAEALAVELGASPTVAAVLSAPARATQETAATIAAAVQAGTPETREELSAPAGESPDALTAAQERAWSIIEDAKTALEPDATLVMVTHGLVVRLLVCRALGMPLEEMDRFALMPGSMTTIEWRTQPRERLLIASLNEVCHLEDQAAANR